MTNWSGVRVGAGAGHWVAAGGISIRTDDHQRNIIVLWRRAVIGMHRLQQPIAQRLRRDVVVEAHDLAQQRQPKNCKRE